MSDVEEAIKGKWLQSPFPNSVPNEASLTGGGCYSDTIIPILFILEWSIHFYFTFAGKSHQGNRSSTAGLPYC